MSIYTHQDSNVRKTWLLMTIFLVVVIGIGWVFSYVYSDPAILYVFVIISILMNIGGYWFSDKLVLSMYRAKQITKSDHPVLWNTVENLSITAGLPMPKTYIIPDPQPNAFATGRNKEHAAVAVTTGLLQILNQSELEGVIAHELAHIGNRDMLLSTVVVVLVGFVTLISDFFLRSRLMGMHSDNDNRGNGNIQGILMIVGIILAILSPLIATLIKLAISRKREFLADASGALLTRYPEGLASALEKISGHSSEPMARANNATAHLFISNPFGGQSSLGFKAAKSITKLFMTHPPMEDRVKALRES